MKKKLLAIIGSPLICCSNSAASSVDVNDEEKMELIGQLQKLDTFVVEGEYPLKNYAAMCYTSAIIKDPEPEPEPVPVPHVPCDRCGTCIVLADTINDDIPVFKRNGYKVQALYLCKACLLKKIRRNKVVTDFSEDELADVSRDYFPVLKIRKKGQRKYRQIILWDFIWRFSREIHYVALYLESGMESDEILEDKVSLIEQVLGEPLVMKEK